MANLIFDIETGPLPWEQIEKFYVPPEPMPPWDDSMCKMGNLRDAAKRADKLAETKAAYELQLANEKQAAADHKAEWASKAALSPITGQVLAIGVRRDDVYAIIGDGGETEDEILRAFWGVFSRHASTQATQFIGYYSNYFDIPFLVWRSYFHNIRVPQSAFKGRYFADAFVDLFDRLPNRGLNGESKKLGDVCSWLGIGGKPEGVDGGMFAALWKGNEESRSQAISYLKNDLDMTYQLAERMGVI